MTPQCRSQIVSILFRTRRLEWFARSSLTIRRSSSVRWIRNQAIVRLPEVQIRSKTSLPSSTLIYQNLRKRGNVSFSPLRSITELGFNAIRLPFIWEAYEPEPGRYDEAYLARLVAVAATAWARGIYVIIDIHQDGFARTLCYGCGAGFPLWAVSPRATPHPPDNGCGCKGWPLLELTDPGVYRSFADFYADAHGVRARYLAMLGRVAGAFAAVPGVVGYDPLNEPWGDERREIAPLYRDAAAALRARHPTAILFLEGRGPTATGFRTRLPRPGLDNIAFAPHYYKPLAIVREDGGGRTAVIDRAFGRMEAKAAEWGVPLLVGEFGIPGGARRAGDYVDYHYDRLDAALASAMQWTVSPRRAPRPARGGTARTSACSTPPVGRGRTTGHAPIRIGWPACPCASDSRRRRRRGGNRAWSSSGRTAPDWGPRRSSCRPGCSRRARGRGPSPATQPAFGTTRAGS